jgi:hypothetical protein
MKISKKILEDIIKEELEATLNEYDVFNTAARGAKIMGRGALNLGKKAVRGAQKIGQAITSPISSTIGSAASEQEYKRYFSERFAGNSREAKSQALSYFARYMDSVKDYDGIIDILVDYYIKADTPTTEAD